MCMKRPLHTHARYDGVMRTNIEIDDELLAEAMKATGLRTKKGTVEAGLQALVRASRQRELLTLRIPDEHFDPDMLEDIDRHRAW